MEIYGVLGVAAGLFFLVGAMRAFSVRRYATVFDEAAHREYRVGALMGRYSGREAEILTVPSDHISSRPAKLRISLACTSPDLVEAVRESMATGLRKVLGVQPDRKTGHPDLDRLYAFRFHDRAAMEASLGRIEVREGLVTLADLGADLVRLDKGRLTVDLPMRFVVPPGVGRIREVLMTMATVASGAESASATRRSRDVHIVDAEIELEEAEEHASGIRRSAMAVTAPAFAAVFFVAMILAFLIVGSFWDFNGKIPWRDRMSLVNARLPLVALVSGLSGFLAALLVPRKPAVWGFLLGWPLVLHAAIVWILFGILRVAVLRESIPGLERELTGQAEFLRAVLTAATVAPAVVVGSGAVGAWVGARISKPGGHPGAVTDAELR